MTGKTDSAGMRAVLVGAGMVAGTHAAALAAAAPAIVLHGVCARRPESARAFAETLVREGGAAPRIYATTEEIAADPEVDMVIVATPPDARAALVAPLAAAGKPILLEKPVGRSGAEAAELVEICEAAGVTLGIVFQHRMRAASRQAARLVASGRLGALGLVRIEVPWWRDQSYYDAPGRGSYARDGGGVLISQAIHTIDLALSLAGPVRSVQAMTATTRFHEMEAEDFACAGLRFADGAVGSLTASTASHPGGAEEIALHFDHASLRLCAGVLEVEWRDGTRETFGATAGTGGGADPMAFTHEWHQAIIEDFAAAIAEKRDPVATGRDALASHDLIDAITRSARERREIDVISRKADKA
ncbi:Gfo/Idh/MocA family protein [Limimaricola pyoseonensis]|uniref:Predicted dehydrogenase n=1 Tax=Limimaricola pyoseonensis TaxID=521013 RepID=A0A1G7EYB4_9RHOB|nr:Gfo/Idh/MocA family oxidoreductase [Limimaricola pyoseonensis]SDE68587.1 Predicted dehydrogenase [Limimaricola pyoseonensis]